MLAIYKSLDEVRGKVDPMSSFVNSESTNKVFALSNAAYIKVERIYSFSHTFSGNYDENWIPEY